MRISTVESGQRFGLQATDAKTNKPVYATFMVMAVGWHPTHVWPAPFTHYRAAFVVFGNGKVAFLDPMMVEFSEPLLCLPAPEQ